MHFNMLVGRCYILNKNHNWTFLLHEFFFFPFFFARIFFLGIFPCMNFFLAFSPSPPPPHHFSNGPSLTISHLSKFHYSFEKNSLFPNIPKNHQKFTLVCVMSVGFLNCLKRERDISVKPIIGGVKTAFR